MEAGELFCFPLLFLFLEHFPVELLFELGQVPEQPGQFVVHGGDGSGRAEPGFPSPKAIGQVIFGAGEASRDAPVESAQ